jgi:parvulin-like peptidyl-prolyl isomerase
MNRPVTIFLVVVALTAGALAGEFFSKQIETHKLAGWIFQRGDLVALFHHRGIFDRELIADEVLQVSVGYERVNKGELDRAMFSLRGQFDGERNFSPALRSNRIWRWQLRQMVADVFRGEKWIEERIASQIHVSVDEVRLYFDRPQPDFAQPLRLRVRHIFLAAPQGSDVIETKRAAMEEIMARLRAGEDFASVAAEVSEDEATKARGGDLGFIAGNRVPPEFWSVIEHLPVNGPVTLVRSHLGFHAIEIVDARPPRAMTFEEAQPEIEQLLAGEKRRAAVAKIREQLAREALLVRQMKKVDIRVAKR